MHSFGHAKSVSLDRPAPGEKNPPSPKPPTEPRKTQKKIKIPQPKQPSKFGQAKTNEPPQQLDAEVCENPPIFDLQDVPVAMDNLGWTVSAKLARMWFTSPAHIYNDDPKSEQPLNVGDITLDWTLKFGNIRKKYENFLANKLYSERAIAAATGIVKTFVEKLFKDGSSTFSFNTSRFLDDLLNFHVDWQFQKLTISDADTFDGLTLTDLTGSLANFNIYAAIGNVEISTEKYFRYERGSNLYCLNAKGRITHIYVYVKDNYSFNGEQYLGHWNKHGIIIAPGTWLTGSGAPKSDSDMDIWVKAIQKPVDTRKSLFGKFKEPDVYFPVFNADYNRWREIHQRGGDFMVYSKPVYLKLKKPIDIKLGEICRLEPSSSLA
ncbi:DUF6402 family protein [Herbaspirillum rubrisubalbicans]|uniref:DUF6402 family protein n=1 Tax=Herbaspirillum rubrisubalbicans TaxID=80842 RepID=UPI0003039011|nr:DUF6402 family protein [Herbaspirillum rubrisubalbicans]